MLTFYVLFVLPVVAILSAIIYLPIYAVNKKKYGKRPFIRHLAIYAWIGVVLSIVYITIFLGGLNLQFDPRYRFLNLVPFIWIRETYEMGIMKMIEQLVMNIVMVIPLGFLLPIVFRSLRKWWKTGITIAIFILCIETLQNFIGRSADVDDLIMNTVGGLIGYGIAILCNKIFHQKKLWNDAINR
jgi:glycopeptide antibiotics resistance protein